MCLHTNLEYRFEENNYISVKCQDCLKCEFFPHQYGNEFLENVAECKEA